VVQVAEELIEAMHCWQMFVTIAEMILAKLAGRISQRLQQLGDIRVFRPHTQRRTRQPDLCQPCPQPTLTGNKRRAARRAALLAIRVGEAHALIGNAVNVRGAIAHHAIAVAAKVCDPDIVTPDNQDVWLACLGHDHLR